MAPADIITLRTVIRSAAEAVLTEQQKKNIGNVFLREQTYVFVICRQIVILNGFKSVREASEHGAHFEVLKIPTKIWMRAGHPSLSQRGNTSPHRFQLCGFVSRFCDFSDPKRTTSAFNWNFFKNSRTRSLETEAELLEFWQRKVKGQAATSQAGGGIRPTR